jgi:hypothetical protein
MSQENSGPCWRKAGRPGHSAARARLRSDSGRSRPRFQALRSPTPAPRRAQPRLGFCPPRTAMPAGEHHPPPGLDDLAERPQVPGSTVPCPTPGPAPARTGRGRRQPAPHEPARAAPAGSGRSPLRPPSPRASSPSRPGFRPGVWQSLPHLLSGLVGRLMDLLLLPPWRRLGTAANTHGTLPHRRTIRWPSAKRRGAAGPLLPPRSVAHEKPAWDDRS